MVRILE